MSDCYFIEEIKDTPCLKLETIYTKMYELEKSLNHKFNDIANLANAMCAKKLNRDGSGGNSKDYYNSSLATVGDAMLKSILSETLFKQGLYKGDITKIKEKMENNKCLFQLSNKYNLKNYAFNEHGFYLDLNSNERLPHSAHDQYLEAIIGAVYFDSNYESCRSWVTKELFTGDKINKLIEDYRQK